MRFLKHIERTRLIAHLVDTSDCSDHDPVRDFEIICGELAAFSPALAAKPMIVVATKLDATTDRTRLDRLRDLLRRARARISRHLFGHAAKASPNWCAPWPMRWTGWRRRHLSSRNRLTRRATPPARRRSRRSVERNTRGTQAAARAAQRPAHRTFRRHVRSHSPGPSGRRASREAALPSRPGVSSFPSAIRRTSPRPTCRRSSIASRWWRWPAPGYPRFVPSLAEAGPEWRRADASSIPWIPCAVSASEFSQPGDHLTFILGADSFLDIASLEGLRNAARACAISSSPAGRASARDALRQVIPPQLLAPAAARRTPRPRARSRCCTRTVYLLDTVDEPRFRHRGAPPARARADAFTGLCLRGVEEYIIKQALYR